MPLWGGKGNTIFILPSSREHKKQNSTIYPNSTHLICCFSFLPIFSDIGKITNNGDSEIISKEITEEKVVLSFKLIDESETIYFDWIFSRKNDSELVKRVENVVANKSQDKTLLDDEEDE